MRCFISLNSAFSDYGRCYILIMGSETKNFSIYKVCPWDQKCTKVAELTFSKQNFFWYGKPSKYFSFEKNVKNAKHRGHFQFPCNPNKELTTSTNVCRSKVQSTAIYFKTQTYFLIRMPLRAKNRFALVRTSMKNVFLEYLEYNIFRNLKIRSKAH